MSEFSNVNRKSNSRWLLGGLGIIAISAFITCFLIVGLYRWVNPPLTWLMVERHFFTEQTRFSPIKQQWVNINSISPFVIQAAVAAEDNLFMNHSGFDYDAIREAREEQRIGKRVRGASTISMQVSKNIFLWHGRTWTRKALEAGFTMLTELLWSKKRIMEVYLNIAELGPSIYGIEAASSLYFYKKAGDINRHEAALMVSALPNPLYRNPSSPSPYMRTYQQRVLRNMKNIGEVDLSKRKRAAQKE